MKELISSAKKRLGLGIIDIHMQLLEMGIITEIKIPYESWILKKVPGLMGWGSVFTSKTKTRLVLDESSSNIGENSA